MFRDPGEKRVAVQLAGADAAKQTRSIICDRYE